MLRLLSTFSWQELRHHPWRYLAALLSIALGVALAFSVHLINASALAEFASSVQSVQGRPDVSLRGRGALGRLDERSYEAVAAQEAVALASPVLEASSYALLDAKNPQVQKLGDKLAVRVLGVDALVAAQLAPDLMMQPRKGAERFALFAPGQAFLNPAARAALGDGPLQILLGQQGGQQIGTLSNAGSVSAKGAPLIVMDLGAMQDAFGLQGQLSRIDIRLRAGHSASALQLPPDTLLQRSEDTDHKGDQLSRAYRVNMTVLALVALFTGAFLVYSVLTLAVAKRAQQWALLGVLGLTAAQRMRLVLLESGLLGLLGSALGIALGTALAALGLQALGGDLGGGYFSGATPPLQWSLGAALIYGALGVLAALAGAWWPARSAQALPLAQTLKGLGAATLQHVKPWLALFLVAAGALLALAPAVFGIPIGAYGSVALLLVGGMGLLPFGVSALYDRLAPHVAQHALPLLAVERARRMREVAVVAVSGVVAALSLGVALTVMVSSFRSSVSQWLDTMLPAPLYARLSTAAPGTHAYFLPAQSLERIAQLPGVARVSGVRHLLVSQRPDAPELLLSARSLPLAEAAQRIPLVSDVRQPPVPGAVPLFVSEAVVDLHGARLGEVFALNWQPFSEAKQATAPYESALAASKSIATEKSQKPPVFYIAGIWRDYVRQFGAVVMNQGDYIRLTGDARIQDLALWLTPSADAQQVQQAVRDLFKDDATTRSLLEFSSSEEIRRISLKLFDRSFAVTYWLQAVAIAIGLFGIATSFSAQVLARRKEFGLLAHLGLTRRQILQVVALEGAAWTAIGALAGCALGLIVSLVLIHVVNPQSFHWTMDTNVPWLRLALLALAVMLAGTLTAWLAGRAAASQDAVLAVKEDW